METSATTPATPAEPSRAHKDSPISTKGRILEALAEQPERPMTVSELGRKLGIDRACILRHARELERDGRVESRRSERKWVYYALKKTP